MDNLKKHTAGIVVAVLLGVSVLAIVLGHNVQIQGGIACLSWGVAVFFLAIATQKRGDQQIRKFDIDMTEILRDVATNGEDSEYYGLIDIEGANKARAKLAKKIRKQVWGCFALGLILLITAIICFV